MWRIYPGKTRAGALGSVRLRGDSRDVEKEEVGDGGQTRDTLGILMGLSKDYPEGRRSKRGNPGNR